MMPPFICRLIELALEGNAPAAIPDEARAAVGAYNADDCRSTEALREWLERLRAELEAQGTAVPRPTAKAGDPNEKVGELERRQQAARSRLLEGVPAEASSPDHEQHPRWLLAYLLDWHRREDKSAWWEYYRLRDLPEADLFDEPQAIAGLEYVERVNAVCHVKTGKPTGSVVDRYRYPAQEVEIGRKGELLDAGRRRIRRTGGARPHRPHDRHPQGTARRRPSTRRLFSSARSYRRRCSRKPCFGSRKIRDATIMRHGPPVPAHAPPAHGRLRSSRPR